MESSAFIDFGTAFDCSLVTMGNYGVRKNENIRCVSIGVGTFPEHGPIIFLPSLAATECSRTPSSEHSSLNDDSRGEDECFNENDGNHIKCITQHRGLVEQLIQVERGIETMVERSVQFIIEKASSHGHMNKKSKSYEEEILQLERHSSSFMKASDLKLETIFSDPPLGAKPNTDERWVELTLWSAETQLVAQALGKAGIDTISDDTLWKADKKTEHILEERSSRMNKNNHTIKDHEGTPLDTVVLIWSGKLHHLGYDIPVFRSSGIVAMFAEDLADLLLDSSRIHEYNKISQGRTDEIVYANDLHTEGVTKVVRSKSKPPFISKPIEFVSLMHARELAPKDGHGKGFVIVTRGVTLANEKYDPSAPEILLNVCLIKKIDGVDGKCELTNTNYISMPMIPLFLVKKLGYNGAFSFFTDIRALCRKI